MENEIEKLNEIKFQELPVEYLKKQIINSQRRIQLNLMDIFNDPSEISDIISKKLKELKDSIFVEFPDAVLTNKFDMLIEYDSTKRESFNTLRIWFTRFETDKELSYRTSMESSMLNKDYYLAQMKISEIKRKEIKLLKEKENAKKKLEEHDPEIIAKKRLERSLKKEI